MFYLTSIFWLLSISGLLTIVFKRKFEMVITISMIFGTLLLYIFGFIGHISYGYYFSWLFVAVFWLIIINWAIKKEKDKLVELKDNMLSVGLFSFLAFLIFSFFLYKYQGFNNCDEFMHWGPMLKETLRIDGFYTQDASKLIVHKDYPPFFTLLEVLWCGFGGFEFHEGYTYIALSSFMFSMFMPALSKLSIKDKKDWLKGVILTIGFVLVGITIDKTVTASDYAFVYNSIYVDWALALFCTYGIYITYKEDKWGLYQFSSLTLVLVTFILMKQMGLVYYIIVLFYAFLKVLFIDKKLNKHNLIKGIVLLIIVPVIFYLSWKRIVNLYAINGQFQIAELSIKEFFNIIRGNTDFMWKYQAFRNYCSNLLRRPLILHPFEMTYFVYVLLIDILIILIFKLKKESYFLAGVYTIGAIGYSAAMLFLYTLAFTADEAPYLASFDRYMASYLYAGTTLLLTLSFDRYAKSTLKEFMVLVFLCFFIEFDTLAHLIPKMNINKTPNLTITVIDQFGSGIEFEREEVNGFRLEFDRLGYLDDGESEFNRLKTALEQNDDLYIIGYDDIIYNYWNRLGIDDYIFNETFYKVENNGKIEVHADAYSFIHYVIMYYQLGV